jgi:hypothetical protein
MRMPSLRIGKRDSNEAVGVELTTNSAQAIMLTLRVDDISVPPEGRTFAAGLATPGPDYEIRITFQQSEWVPQVLEHIKVFIETPLGVAATVAVSTQLVDFFLAWAKEQRLKRPEQDEKKLTIYGPDRKPVKIMTVKGDRFEEE